MRFNTRDDLVLEIDKRLAAYCEAADQADLYSGRFIMSIEVTDPKRLILSEFTIPKMVGELFPPSGSSSTFTVTCQDKVLDKKLFSFYYRKEWGAWFLEPDESPNP